MHGNKNKKSPADKVDYRKALKFILNRIKPHLWLIIIAVILSIIGTIAGVLMPSLLGNVTDGIIKNMIANETIVKIINIIICLIILLIISSVCSYLNGFIMGTVNKKICFKLRKELNSKINSLPLTYFDKTKSGEILAFTTTDIETISNTLTQDLTEIINSLVAFIGYLVMMIRISGWMTLAISITIPIFLVILIKIIGRSQKYFKSQQDYLGHINGHIEEMYAGQQVNTLFNNQENAIKELDNLNETLYNSAWKSNFLSGLMHPIMMAFSNLGFVLSCIIGGVLAVKGRISIGNIQAFISYARNFSNPLTQLASITGYIQQAFAAAYRIDNYLNEPNEIETGSLELDKNIKGEIKFEHVAFSYDKKKPVIKDLSLNIKPGQKVAIVGPTGAGKTTIVKLLMRYYDIDSGNIKIDDIDIKDVKKESLRNKVGMVLQDTWLFEGTIRENLTFGNPKATQKQIEEAVDEASLTHIINTLPNNYDFVINEETTNVSEGEKQLLTIARTFLLNPNILILDEATSNVDTRTETLIQDALGKLMQDKTSFIIAHRLSTIINADVILVMNDGDVIEIGNHETLLKAKGFYADLYNSQFER